MKNKIIEFIAKNPVMNIISGGAFICMGLGWLGLIDGWSDNRSIISDIFGCIFILSGGATVISTIINEIKIRRRT